MLIATDHVNSCSIRLRALSNCVLYWLQNTTAPTGDSNITCHVNDTVSSLKESVIRQLAAQGKNVRLIFAGKMLDIDQNPLSEYGIADGSFVHAVVTSMRGGTNATGQSPRAAAANSGPISYRGFDRLTQIGLSINETAALRSSFNPQVNEFIAVREYQPNDGEDSTAFRFRMEEEWIASQSARSEFSLNLPSDRVAAAAGGGGGRQGQRGGGLGYAPLATFEFAPSRTGARRRAAGAGGETVDRPSNPGTMNDFFWGLAMG